MFDRLISIFVPHECLGCGAEGSVLCAACQNLLPALPERCYHCRKLSPGGVTCRSCHRTSKLTAVHVATEYGDLAKTVVWRLKFSHARQAAEAMANAVAERITLPDDVLLVHVPTASSRVRQRGFDQAQLLARPLSRRYGLPHLSCLARIGQSRQVGASRNERLRHITGAFRLKSGYDVRGTHVVLVDDVLTTGATLDAAAAVLKRSGAKRVDAVVFAQA